MIRLLISRQWQKDLRIPFANEIVLYPRIEGVIAREAAKLGQTPDEVREGYLRQTALHTFIDARDIADMCLYLCSPMGAKISGQVLTIDGFTENCHS